MAYRLCFNIALGAAKTGLTLEAQLVDEAGSNVGSAVTSGFVEIGSTGNYLWDYASIPDGHRGGVVFQIESGGAIQAFTAINPEEAETSILTKVADAVLGRDLSAVTGAAARSLLNAVRFLRNRWTVAAGTLTVYQEDDSTPAWTGAVTSQAGADPVIANDPS